MRPQFLPLVAFALAGPLAAQNRIAIGGNVTGRLTPADERFRDGSRYKTYTFQARTGDTITAELASDDFDAMLVLTDALGNRLVANDDGAERCNARLSYVVATPGAYQLYANSSGPYGLGAYRLTLARGARPAPADTTCRDFLALRGVIEVGGTLTDTLTVKDLEFTDSTFFRRYALPIGAKQTVTVDLQSTTFDAFLLLERGRGERLVKNDDGSGGCDARLVYTATDDRPLMIVANTAVRRQTGPFTVRVTAGALPTELKGTCRLTSAEAGARRIAVGENVSGELTSRDRRLSRDSTYFQEWVLDGRAGHTVTIDLESAEFDAFVFLLGPRSERPLQDDDTGGNCNARLTATLPDSGAYTIVVNTSRKHATGTFSLSVTPGSKPPSLARCARAQ
jgi:hypothetical protein